jgi:hypothetical protein
MVCSNALFFADILVHGFPRLLAVKIDIDEFAAEFAEDESDVARATERSRQFVLSKAEGLQFFRASPAGPFWPAGIGTAANPRRRYWRAASMSTNSRRASRVATRTLRPNSAELDALGS